MDVQFTFLPIELDIELMYSRYDLMFRMIWIVIEGQW